MHLRNKALDVIVFVSPDGFMMRIGAFRSHLLGRMAFSIAMRHPSIQHKAMALVHPLLGSRGLQRMPPIDQLGWMDIGLTG